MGAFQGGLTFKQYYVDDPLPSGWPDLFQQGIARQGFKPIEISSEVERSIGWASVHFALDTELEPEMYTYNEYLVLAMRIDTLTVPGPLLAIYSEAEARRVMQEQKRPSLNRYERAEIKERIKIDLRKKLFPSIKTVDMVWNWETGVVRFYAANEKTNLEFQDLFEQTFDRVLIPDGAFTAATRGAVPGGMKLDAAQLAALDEVEPHAFVDIETAVAAMKEG